MPFALSVLAFHLHLLGAAHRLVPTGQGQAALLTALLTLGLYDFRVNQFHRAVAAINDHNTLENAHLHRSQTHAVVLIHGLKHILHQSGDTSVKHFHRATLFS